MRRRLTGITSYRISVQPNHPNKSWELSLNTTSQSKSTSSKYTSYCIIYLSILTRIENIHIYIYIYISIILICLKPIDLIKSTTQLLCLVTIRSWKHPEMTSTTIYSTREMQIAYSLRERSLISSTKRESISNNWKNLLWTCCMYSFSISPSSLSPLIIVLFFMLSSLINWIIQIYKYYR